MYEPSDSALISHPQSASMSLCTSTMPYTQVPVCKYSVAATCQSIMQKWMECRENATTRNATVSMN